MRLLPVNYRDVSLTVEGKYYEGEEPAFFSVLSRVDKFEIERIFAGEVDIYNVFECIQIEDIQRLCIEKLNTN